MPGIGTQRVIALIDGSVYSRSVCDHPAWAAGRLGAGIDLLVMGAYGHSRIRSLIMGSTTTQMIRSCLIPVMLFR